MTPKIIVHGGARSSISQEAEQRKDVIAACQEGYDVLRKQGAVDAVELSIQRLEASKYLNAGFGSYLQLDGRVTDIPVFNSVDPDKQKLANLLLPAKSRRRANSFKVKAV